MSPRTPSTIALLEFDLEGVFQQWLIAHDRLPKAEYLFALREFLDRLLEENKPTTEGN